MSSQVIPFQHETYSIRVIADSHGQPWFVAKDVCDALSYADVSMTVRKLDDDEKGTSLICTPSGDQEMLTINESGLYSLILTSRKAEAKKFKRWVTHDVLPTIRKTGRYTHPDYRPEETREVHAGGLTHEQQDAVKALHKSLVESAPQDQRGALAVKLWSSIKKKFGVSYKDVPPTDFTAVLSLMSRVAVEGEYLPKPEPVNALHELPMPDVFGSFRALLVRDADGSMAIKMMRPDCIVFAPEQLPELITREPAQFPVGLMPRIIEAAAKRLQR